MGFLSDNPVFVPCLVILAAVLLWKGGRRGWVFVLLLALAAGLCNELLVEPLKGAFERARPFVVLPDAVLRTGRGSPMESLPSSHAVHSALIATITGWFYPRALWAVAPIAFGVGLSRIYNGVHFPGDVLAGFLIGVGFGALFLWSADRLWRLAAPRLCPGIARRIESLLRPDDQPRATTMAAEMG